MWKRYWASCIIIFSLFGVKALGIDDGGLPFWRTKPKLMKSINDQRRVVVSVDLKTEGRDRLVKIMGVGAVNVPLYFAVEQLQRFEELPKVSSYFQKVKHDREEKEIYFFIKAFGKQIRFIQQYQWGPRTPKRAQMDWRVKWGKIEGMVGNYQLRSLSPHKTEIAIWASMKKQDIPLPEFLINFTLEVIAEKTAQKMRAFMENNFRNAKKLRDNHVKKR